MEVVEVVPPVEPSSSGTHGDRAQEFNNGEHGDGYNVKDEYTDMEEATNGEDEEEDYDEGDYDPEAEAEAVARALEDQIWAELGQGLGESIPAGDTTMNTGAGQTATELNQAAQEGEEIGEDKTTLPGIPSHEHRPPSTTPEFSEQPSQLLPPVSSEPDAPVAPDPMIETIKTMLSLALCDPHVHYALMTTIVPGPVANGANLYTILSDSVLAGRVNPELAQPLSILISALASGSMLVASESPYPTSSHLDTGVSSSALKRKRDPADEGQTWPTPTAYNPSVQPASIPRPTRSPTSEELVSRIQSAASDILQVLDPLLSVGQSLGQSALSSIQRQLHQVYSFVSTCPQQQEPSEGGSLQEIGGLIQVIGILNGVPIAQSTESTGHADTGATDSNRGGRGANNTFSTSLYPCSTCSKTFNKLSSLRAHERTHSEGRPYRCEYAGCPASFARNHDLRRHEKSHERQMFRCRGCDRLFSRRDALRRHKTNEKALDECRDAPMDTSTVQHDGDPPRVTRVWQNHPEGGDWPRESEFEDGEIQPGAVADARRIVGTLYKTLQQHVTNGLSAGTDSGPSDSQPPPTAVEGDQPDPAKPATPITTLPDMPQEGASGGAGDVESDAPSVTLPDPKPTSTLPGYDLDDEHASLLERAIAVAAQAAQVQAEAEAAMYEEPYYDDEQDVDGWGEEENECKPQQDTSAEAANLVC